MYGIYNMLDTEEEEERHVRPMINDGVREIEIDPQVLREIQEVMEQTGEVQFSAAPDPKDQDSKKSTAIEETKKTPVLPKKSSFCQFCCSPEMDESIEDSAETVYVDIPTSKYSDANNGVLLPPQEECDKNKITLVLDLDETLVHSTFVSRPKADFKFHLEVGLNDINVWVSIRPGAEEFLREVGKLYEVVLFTASTRFYADCIVNEIDKTRSIKYRLYRDSCSNIGGCRVKDLSLLGRNLKKTIIIDNSSVAYLLHPYNAIEITSWYDDKKDKELGSILSVLKKSYRLSRVYELLSDL